MPEQRLNFKVNNRSKAGLKPNSRLNTGLVFKNYHKNGYGEHVVRFALRLQMNNHWLFFFPFAPLLKHVVSLFNVLWPCNSQDNVHSCI